MTTSPAPPAPLLRSGLSSRVARLGVLALAAAGVATCGEQARFPTGGGGDTTPPTVSVVIANTLVAIDSTLSIRVVAADNIRLKTLKVTVAGDTVAGCLCRALADTLVDTTFTAVVATLDRTFNLAVPARTAGRRIAVTANVTDGSDSPASATDTVRIYDDQAPTITLVAPGTGVTVGAGDTLKVIASMWDSSGIRFAVGRIFTRDVLGRPVVIARDSQVYAAADLAIVDTFNVPVPDTLAPGTYLVGVIASDNALDTAGVLASKRGESSDGSVAVADVRKPFGSFLNPPADSAVAAGDSVRVRFQAQDLTGVSTVVLRGISARGDSALGTDTVVLRFESRTASFATPPRDAEILRYLRPVLSDSTREDVTLEAKITDVGGNDSTIRRRIAVAAGPFVRVTAPDTGSRQPVGVPLSIALSAFDPDSVEVLGFTARGAVSGADSTVFISPLATSRTTTLALAVSATAPLGADTITPFATDRLGNRFLGPAVVVSLTDTLKPTVNILAPAVADTQVAAGDSLLVRVRVRDNRGVSSVTLEGRSRRGVDSLGTGATVTRFAQKTVSLAQRTDTTFSRYLLPVLTDSTAENVYLVVQAQDSAGNVQAESLRVRVAGGPFARVTSPAAGAQHPVGTALSIALSAFDRDSVKVLGFTARGAVSGADSTVFTSPLATSRTTTLALAVSATAPLGADTITPFATDRLGNRFLGPAVVVSFADTVKPTVEVQAPGVADFPVAAGDSVLVTVRVQDNKGVTTAVLSGTSQRGSVSLGTDTTVTRFTSRTVTLAQKTDTTISRYLRAAAGDSTSERVSLIVLATDSSGNSAADSVQVRIVSGPVVTIVRPSAGSVTSAGKGVTIQLRGVDPQGVRILGWRASGVVTAQDSVIAAPSGGVLADTLVFTDTLTVPGGTPVGNIVITAFASDSLGDPSGSVPTVTVAVQTIAGDVAPPLVTFTVAARVEVDDSITVRATDASGILVVGWVARVVGGTTIIRRDSVLLSGSLTDVTQAFQLGLDTISTFPRLITVEAFAVDSATNRGVSTKTGVALSSPAAKDTLTVVAGKTIALPAGGEVADAIYNRNRNELYLSNILLNRIEVFRLADSTFGTAIPVGSRPWGLALWPRDTLGNNADTLIVANSGGTNLSIVEVTGAPVERRRHRLPNFLIQKFKTATDEATGAVQPDITELDFSDRPEFVAAVCRRGGAGACDSVIAVYSTLPTAAQTEFAGRGTVRWENLSAPASAASSHFFWEHATVPPSLASDTLQVIAVRDTVPGAPRREIVLGAGCGVTVDYNELVFQDTTFVRNSGDFNHVLIGEGGIDQGFARAMLLDRRAAVPVTTCPGTDSLLGLPLSFRMVRDSGISEGIHVRDFLVNRAAPVRSIATNFNAMTNFVRADSIYAFDLTLRQQGLIAVGGAPGVDFDPDHKFDASARGTGGFGGTADSTDRVVYAARPDASFDVFDTFFYGLVTTIPVRDPIIGPLRVAKNASGQQLLIGTTANGIVIVRLPSVANIFPVSQFRAGSP